MPRYEPADHPEGGMTGSVLSCAQEPVHNTDQRIRPVDELTMLPVPADLKTVTGWIAASRDRPALPGGIKAWAQQELQPLRLALGAGRSDETRPRSRSRRQEPACGLRWSSPEAGTAGDRPVPARMWPGADDGVGIG